MTVGKGHAAAAALQHYHAAQADSPGKEMGALCTR